LLQVVLDNSAGTMLSSVASVHEQRHRRVHIVDDWAKSFSEADATPTSSVASGCGVFDPGRATSSVQTTLGHRWFEGQRRRER
jgi:hypothetical protein